MRFQEFLDIRLNGYDVLPGVCRSVIVLDSWIIWANFVLISPNSFACFLAQLRSLTSRGKYLQLILYELLVSATVTTSSPGPTLLASIASSYAE